MFKKPQLHAVNLKNNSISVLNTQMPKFEFPWSLSMANNTTLSPLPTTTNVSSSMFPIRNFSLEQLTSTGDMQYLGFSERSPSTTTVPKFSLYTQLSKYRLIYLTIIVKFRMKNKQFENDSLGNNSLFYLSLK